MILSWAEVWALAIPILVLIFFRVNKKSIKEVVIYLFIALLLNSVIDIISHYFKVLPSAFQNNNIYYNIHSVIRVSLFSVYFIRTSDPADRITKKIVFGFFIAFVLLNFIFFEPLGKIFSSRLFTAEGVVMLFYCFFYFLNSMRQENVRSTNPPVFWLVTGLSIYECVSFFIFLFYRTLSVEYTTFALKIWDIHNIAYIILCIFIAKALYESREK
jgi:hypothetical protein